LFEDIVIRFDRMYERDGQTDRQTPHDGYKAVLHVSIARQKVINCLRIN